VAEVLEEILFCVEHEIPELPDRKMFNRKFVNWEPKVDK